MTILQRLQVRQSEIRESINTLLGNDARTETEQGELGKADRRRAGRSNLRSEQPSSPHLIRRMS